MSNPVYSECQNARLTAALSGTLCDLRWIYRSITSGLKGFRSVHCFFPPPLFSGLISVGWVLLGKTKTNYTHHLVVGKEKNWYRSWLDRSPNLNISLLLSCKKLCKACWSISELRTGRTVIHLICFACNCIMMIIMCHHTLLSVIYINVCKLEFKTNQIRSCMHFTNGILCFGTLHQTLMFVLDTFAMSIMWKTSFIS